MIRPARSRAVAGVMIGRSALGAVRAQPVEREVREAHVVAELGPEQFSGGVGCVLGQIEIMRHECL